MFRLTLITSVFLLTACSTESVDYCAENPLLCTQDGSETCASCPSGKLCIAQDTCGDCWDDSQCPQGSGVTGACSDEGVCVECTPGFADCDGDKSNGCETNLLSASDCGSCGATCETDSYCHDSMCWKGKIEELHQFTSTPHEPVSVKMADLVVDLDDTSFWKTILLKYNDGLQFQPVLVTQSTYSPLALPSINPHYSAEKFMGIVESTSDDSFWYSLAEFDVFNEADCYGEKESEGQVVHAFVDCSGMLLRQAEPRSGYSVQNQL